MMDRSERTLGETRERFGYQWTRFAYLTPEFERHFLDLIAPMSPEDFRGRTVLDAGCGYGRYARYAAKYGARVIGMDFSEAIVAAQEITRDDGIGLVRGDILHPPFPPQFDIVMSIGVLHHLPDPEEGFAKLARCVKPGGKIVIWVYSAERRFSNALIESTRRLVRFLPHNALRVVTFLLAVPDFLLSKVLGLIRLFGDALWRRAVPTHFRLYSQFPFRVSWADWFDRLGAPMRHYYTPEELKEWSKRVGARETIQPTQDFGLTLVAQFDQI